MSTDRPHRRTARSSQVSPRSSQALPHTRGAGARGTGDRDVSQNQRGQHAQHAQHTQNEQRANSTSFQQQAPRQASQQFTRTNGTNSVSFQKQGAQAAQGAQGQGRPSQAFVQTKQPVQAAQGQGRPSQAFVQAKQPAQTAQSSQSQPSQSFARGKQPAQTAQPAQPSQGRSSQPIHHTNSTQFPSRRDARQENPQNIVQAERAVAKRSSRRPTRRKENRLTKGMKIAITCCIVLVCAVAGVGAYVLTNVSQSQEEAKSVRDTLAMEHTDKSVGAVAVTDLPATGRGELVAQGSFDPNDARLDTLKEMLDAYPKNIGMVIYSCDGSKALSYNSTGTFFSACTIKMAFMYYVSQQLEAGNGSLDEVMTYMPYHYHTGSGDIKYQSMYTDYTIRDLIWYLLTISDNIAYEMLRSRYGYDGQNQLMESIGSYSLMTGDALWAYDAQPRDYVAVWMYYYNYFLSDSEVAKVMYDACTNTDYNYATETLTQYDYSHKSGDNFEPLAAYNDTGILWCDHPYIYIVLSSSDLFGDWAQEENEIMELVNELFR